MSFCVLNIYVLCVYTSVCDNALRPIRNDVTKRKAQTVKCVLFLAVYIASR